MSMADDDRVDLVGRDMLQQPRHRRVADVEHQAEPVVFDEVSAACLARFGPGPARAENGESHSPDGIPPAGAAALQEMAAFTSSTIFFSTVGLHFWIAYDT